MHKVRPPSLSGLFGGGGIGHSRRYNSEDLTISSHRHASSVSSVSDSPLSSPTFSFRGSKPVSASSSLASTPPGHDAIDAAKEKLPALQEDPMEIGQEGQDSTWSDELFERWSQDIAGGRPNTLYAYPDDQDGPNGFYSDSESGLHHFAKRRRSGDTTFNSFATRIHTRFPSLSKRSKERKRASVAIPYESPLQSPSPPVSRSHSRARSFRRPSIGNSGELEEPHGVPGPIDTIVEDEGGRESVAFMHDGVFFHAITKDDTPDPEARVPTPLLHPLMDTQDQEPTIQSPLQSPAVESSHSSAKSQSYTPVDTPCASGIPTPPLSTKPSVGSVNRSKGNTIVPSGEIPPIFIADQTDEWSDKLGHANYQILPEPYFPHYCDAGTCAQLFQDWQKARAEYAKHLARTQTHFGEASKIIKFTEAKWSSIEAQWKQNYDLASQRALDNGAKLPDQYPAEPTPVTKIPDIDTMINQGKIPNLGDNGIVEPMEQVAAQVPANPPVQRRTSKKAQFFKMLGGFQLPGTKFNRSVSSPPPS